jgi:hypothetical protein
MGKEQEQGAETGTGTRNINKFWVHIALAYLSEDSNNGRSPTNPPTIYRPEPLKNKAAFDVTP